MAAFAPEVIAHLGPLPLTNTLIHTLLVDGVLLGSSFYLAKRIKQIPSGLQSIVEPIIEQLYSLSESTTQNKKALNAIFPFIATFFLFIFVANFTGLFPGVGTIGFYPEKKAVVTEAHAAISETEVEEAKTESHSNFVPLIRGTTSDFNTTLALALISAIATHGLGIYFTGVKDYLARWFSLNPINLYVGLLELISEVTKVVSLSFRLFGNIYAGEIALHTISNLVAFIVPLPFLLLESIVSFVQALVFSVLTLVFMSMMTTPHHAEEHA